MAVVYIDGKFYDNREDAKISVWDHGFLYGDGIFEGIRVYDGNVFLCREHLQRLYDSAKTICIDMPFPIEEMERIVVEAIKRSKMTDCYIRLVVSRGSGDLGLDPRKCCKPTIVIIVDTISLFPKELYDEGIKVIIAATRKNHVASVNPNIKSLNYMNCILAKIEAVHQGAAEAILLNHEGHVTEGTADNIFVIKNGEVKTPPSYAGILIGITRNAIIDICKKKGIPISEVNMTTFDLYSADEIFLTGSGAELIPVIEIDRRIIGNGKPGPMFKKLLNGLHEITKVEGIKVYNEKELEELKTSRV